MRTCFYPKRADYDLVSYLVDHLKQIGAVFVANLTKDSTVKEPRPWCDPEKVPYYAGSVIVKNNNYGIVNLIATHGIGRLVTS